MALNEKNEREFKVLTEREHVLERPAMYIGSIDCNDREMWLLNKDTNKFEFKTVHYNPGAIKCFSEILDNCLDAAIDGNFKTLSKISVKFDGPEITVTDNGPGIPVEVAEGDKKKRTKPELAWCQARAGTSFNEQRDGIGANGLGSTCTNIFSVQFDGTSDDGKHRQTISCRNNMGKIKAGEIKPSKGKSGVTCTFTLDYKRFGLPETGFDEVHQTIVYQRMLVLSMMYPKVSFSFNGKTINLKEADFANLFSENALTYKTPNTRFILFENNYDAFHAFTYVNGLEMPRGGTHVNVMVDSVCKEAREKLVKKYKTIKPGDIKGRICAVVLLTGFKNPEFDAQNKEQLTNSVPAITAHLDGKLDFEKIAKDLIKCEAISDPIIEMFKLKEEVKDRVALKQSLRGKTKIDADKYLPATGRGRKYMLICEGLSALGGISQALGRDGIAYYAGRGVPLNVWKAKPSAMTSNKEFVDIMTILGLDPTKPPEQQQCDFGKIVHANDADADGIHICSLYLGWWLKLAPGLFNQRRICRLITPLAVLYADKSKKKILNYFYTLDEYKAFESAKPDVVKKGVVCYYKGLGSWSKDEFQRLFASSKNGIEDFLEPITLDDVKKDMEILDDWLSDEKSDKRKEYLRQYSLDINQV